MIFREYQRGDFTLITPNRLSDVDGLADAMDDRQFTKHTLVDELGPVCIVAFVPYWGDNYHVFFIGDLRFNGRHAVKLRQHLHNVMIERKAVRVQTDSEDDPMNNKFHEFLGFSKEGTRRKLIYGKDYNMWGIVNGF